MSTDRFQLLNPHADTEGSNAFENSFSASGFSSPCSQSGTTSRPRSLSAKPTRRKAISMDGRRVSYTAPRDRRLSFSQPRGHRDDTSSILNLSFETSRPACVAVRVRPATIKELRRGPSRVVSCNGDKVILTNPNAFQADEAAITAAAALASYHNWPHNDWASAFRFDYALPSYDRSDPSYASQLSVYEAVGECMVEDALQGYNSSCFAYGHSASGKTYTMFGDMTQIPVQTPDPSPSGTILSPSHSLHQRRGCNEEGPGLIPRVFAAIMHELQQSNDSDGTVLISFMEIYNDTLKDLLESQREGDLEPPGALRIRETASTGPFVDNLTKLAVHTVTDMMGVLNSALTVRATATTDMNDQSSRSHAIVTLEVPGQGRVQMVDLAGNDSDQYKVSVTGSSSIPSSRLKLEINSISMSLSTLATVVKSLGDRTQNPPFRDSKLTWLLKDGLSGTARCTMIATVSPHRDRFKETKKTLHYAARLSQLKKGYGIISLDDTVDPSLAQLLMSDVTRLKQELGAKDPNSRAASHLLQATVTDPQQRLAKLLKDAETEKKQDENINGKRSAFERSTPKPSCVDAQVQCNLIDAFEFEEVLKKYQRTSSRVAELELVQINLDKQIMDARFEIDDQRRIISELRQKPQVLEQQLIEQERILQENKELMGRCYLEIQEHIARRDKQEQEAEETAYRLATAEEELNEKDGFIKSLQKAKDVQDREKQTLNLTITKLQQEVQTLTVHLAAEQREKQTLALSLAQATEANKSAASRTLHTLWEQTRASDEQATNAMRELKHARDEIEHLKHARPLEIANMESKLSALKKLSAAKDSRIRTLEQELALQRSEMEQRLELQRATIAQDTASSDIIQQQQAKIEELQNKLALQQQMQTHDMSPDMIKRVLDILQSEGNERANEIRDLKDLIEHIRTHTQQASSRSQSASPNSTADLFSPKDDEKLESLKKQLRQCKEQWSKDRERTRYLEMEMEMERLRVEALKNYAADALKTHRSKPCSRLELKRVESCTNPSTRSPQVGPISHRAQSATLPYTDGVNGYPRSRRRGQEQVTPNDSTHPTSVHNHLHIHKHSPPPQASAEPHIRKRRF